MGRHAMQPPESHQERLLGKARSISRGTAHEEVCGENFVAVFCVVSEF